MNKSHWDEHKKQLVEAAIAKYAATGCCSAGFNILRYARKHAVKVDNSTSANVFIAAYPVPSDYIILTLAKQGKISYAG
jgi:hypothetical protein